MLTSDEFDEEYELERQMRHKRLKDSINRAFEENKELLDRLGSDYDENGIPYWEKNG